MPKFKKHEIILGIVIGLIVSFCIVGLFANSPVPLNNARELYKQAKKYQENKDYQSAYDKYTKISSKYPAFAMVLFQEAVCAASLGNEKVVINKLETILSSHKDSRIAPIASYNLAQAYLRIKDKDRAQRQFQYTIDNFPNTDYSVGSYYYLGEINQKTKPQLSRNYWVKYLSLSPNGRFAQECLTGIWPLVNQLNSVQKLSIGISLFENQDYKKAYEILKWIPLKDSWYYLAKSEDRTGNYANALNTYKTGITKYSSSFDEPKIEQSMRAIVRLNGKPEVDSWSDIIKISSKGKDYAFFSKAKLVPYRNANEFYKAIIAYFPKGEYASESLWTLFWYEFNRGNYSGAIQLGKKHISTFSNKKATPKIMFWTAKAYERADNKHLAIKFYNKLLRDYPDSYYSFRASRLIKALDSGEDIGWHTDNPNLINVSDSKSFTPYSYDDLKKKYGVEVAELTEVEDYDLISLLKLQDLFIDSWIKYRNGIYSKSIVLARDGMEKLMPKPDKEDNRWKLIYQVHFKDIINEYSPKNNLDPFITLSLSREESYFNPLAVSSSNARGLMQLLPGTASDISRWKHLGSINSLALFNPSKNIEFGSAYLGHIKEMLGNSNLYAVAAYNSGPGSVQRWLNSYPHKDMDQFVENIPYEQTRTYVKKVFGSYWNYKRIYNPQ